MRLSTKFILLIAGTFLIPLATLLLAFAWIQINADDDFFLGASRTFEALRLHELIRDWQAKPSSADDFARAVQAVSPDVSLALYDAGGALLFSSFPEGAFEKIARPDAGSGYLLRRMTLHAADGRSFTLLIGSSRIVPIWATLTTQVGRLPAVTGRIIIGSILAFMILMSTAIIRSINSSIARLEIATRRISEGDLDFKLEARGSDRIASLTRSFDAMRVRVREEAAVRSRFILAISHDLKTPLSSITGYLDAIGDGMAAGPDDLAKYLAIIRDKTGVLEGRIRQLIDYVKMETSEWKSARQEVGAARFLDEAGTVFRTEAAARGYAFQWNVDVPAALSISMDQDLVFRALENLVQNVFQHAAPGSAIRFSAQEEEHGLVLSLADSGGGIRESDLPFIFEPFYRGRGTRRETGFGLGLSVVKSVVSSHGWAIDVSLQSGETCFTITIPRQAFLVPSSAR